MNCIDLFQKRVNETPNKMALLIPGKERATFLELQNVGSKAQGLLLENGAKPGDAVLLLDTLGVRLYGCISALLSLGCSVILVEPWMPVAKIQKMIELAKPKFFLSNPIGFLWGARVQAIRNIPRWIRIGKIASQTRKPGPLILEELAPETPGILTFTSGTTGDPKGVVRTQGYLMKQHEVLAEHLHAEQYPEPDLCIFANFVLSNLGSGRGSVIIPPAWKPETLASIDHLPREYQPVTLTTGPAFLLQLQKHAQANSLRAVHVGGALTDCAIFERAFERWPTVHWGHIYGGSEVEPVAVTDARKAVEFSRKKNYFQTLFLGENVSQISPRFETDTLWVAGPHVCPEYLGNEKENRIYKHKDASGRLWHAMGDRVKKDESGWWYMGRSGQPLEEFQLEQDLYSFLGSSKSFVLMQGGQKTLVGENLRVRKPEILKNFPQINAVCETRIFRDRRHRARIDRKKSIEKGPSWLQNKN
ncbi:MAG: AMP-binding protein [Bdellovibrio sp.]|nr:AMP-binding protein [Bdellovibrio sp.]